MEAGAKADLLLAEAGVIGIILHVGSNTYIRFHDISQFSSEKIRGGGMAGAAGICPFTSAAVMPQTGTGTYVWCRKVVESQFDSCRQ